MLMIKVPMMPMPVHMAYPIPRGMTFSALDNKQKLIIIPRSVITEGTGRLNPWDIFSAIAQKVSNSPAEMRYNQYIKTTP